MFKNKVILVAGATGTVGSGTVRAFLNEKEHFPGVVTTEPGYQYPYDNEKIMMDIKKKLRI